jgi:hypothetical protein
MHTGFRPCAFPWCEAPTGGCFVEEGSVEAVFERAHGLVAVGCLAMRYETADSERCSVVGCPSDQAALSPRRC